MLQRIHPVPDQRIRGILPRVTLEFRESPKCFANQFVVGAAGFRAPAAAARIAVDAHRELDRTADESLCPTDGPLGRFDSVAVALNDFVLELTLKTRTRHRGRFGSNRDK